jgi:hypothetical protein
VTFDDRTLVSCSKSCERSEIKTAHDDRLLLTKAQFSSARGQFNSHTDLPRELNLLIVQRTNCLC